MAKIAFTILWFVLLAALIIFYAVGTVYEYNAGGLARNADYQNIHVMVFLGFGFMMAFMYKCGLTATCHTFFIAAFSLLWAILMRGFWRQIIQEADVFEKIQIGVEQLIAADFCTMAVVVSMAAMIGRVSALQLLVMAIIEVVIFAINEAVLNYKFVVTDRGGTMSVFMFGCYFGLACSLVVGLMQGHHTRSSELLRRTRQSDMFSMIGTLFLFCYWPSFNSAMAGPFNYGAQQRAITNSVLGITMGVFLAFGMNQLLRFGKFRMAEVQRATIAGGIALGVLADMAIHPYMALLVGGAAGVIAVVGFNYVSDFLRLRLNLLDTMGIHNFIGMPSILGAIVGVCYAAGAVQSEYVNEMDEVFPEITSQRRSAQTQALYQLAGIGTTLGFALVGGALTGLCMYFCDSLNVFYDDLEEYELDDELYYVAPIVTQKIVPVTTVHAEPAAAASDTATLQQQQHGNNYTASTAALHHNNSTEMNNQPRHTAVHTNAHSAA
jgi:ammonium transporter Rh